MNVRRLNLKLLQILLLTLSWATLLAQDTLPEWTIWSPENKDLLVVELPAQLEELPEPNSARFLLLRLDPQWAPQWKDAAFKLKGLVVALKSKGVARVGILATQVQVDALLSHELAPYLDGYVYSDEPYLPQADETGKLWERVQVEPKGVLNALIDAASLGTELVLFEGLVLTDNQRGLLKAVAATKTGSLDLQPTLNGFDPGAATFFLDPASGNYHLALFTTPGESVEFTFPLSKGTAVTLLYPEGAGFRHRQYSKITELRLDGDVDAYFFLLEPGEKAGTSESLEVRTQKIIDPYELVVKNQVFKKEQAEGFSSLEVDEELNYRYQATGGIDFDVTYMDTVIEREGLPIERIRRETYLSGVKWNSEKQPELPLISPEKVQTAPLVIDLDKSYRYTYKGEDTIDGFPTWKVTFAPSKEGKFFTGTVWIDQQSGAHRKLRAIQSGLEPPVVGNEMIVYFDWVEVDGRKYWAQVREENLQMVNIVGERIVVQISGKRTNFRFNEDHLSERLKQAYAGKATILRDSEAGFRYLKRTADGGREVSSENFFKKKAVLGGILMDPALDTPIPLAGFNYTNLEFLDGTYQANFFIAGAINDLIVSKPNFLDKGWDFTAELFLTPLYFGDTVYENNEEREDLEVEALRESFNITLGIPLNTFFKLSGNYGLRYLDYKAADDTDENYVLPKSHLQHIGRLNLEYSRSRFTSSLEYEFVKRSDWDDFGLPEDTDTVEDSFRVLQFDATISKRLPMFQTIALETRYLKGWDLDRFSRFGFGFFENRVPGFGTSGIRGDEAIRLKAEYEIGIKGLFNLDFNLTGARAMLDEPVIIGGYAQPEEVDLAGLGVAINFLGPWRSLIRVDMGYGLYSSLPEEEGDFSGQVVFLKLF